MPITLDAETIAALHVPELGGKVTTKLRDNLASVQIVQTRHRLDVLQHWGGPSTFHGAAVLELGCGQGDMSSVLAAAVSEGGSKGSVIAWDPAPGSYGSPLTLSEAHDVILSEPDLPLGFRIDTSLESVLQNSTFAHAVLVHSLYYFGSESILHDTFKTLAAHRPPIKHLFLAEYALIANHMCQIPHLLSVLAQSASHALDPNPQSNVRTVLSPARIAELAKQAGWNIHHEAIFDPIPDLQDGGWEASTVASWSDTLGDGKAPSMNAFKDATVSAMRALKEEGEKVQTMPVWCAVFENGSA